MPTRGFNTYLTSLKNPASVPKTNPKSKEREILIKVLDNDSPKAIYVLFSPQSDMTFLPIMPKEGKNKGSL